MHEARTYAGAKEFSVSGGEPLIRPQILNVLDYAKKLGYKILLYTGGNVFDKGELVTPITKDLAQSLAKRYGMAGSRGSNLKIIFNVQGPEEKLVAKLMGREDAFENLVRSIRNCVDTGIWTEAHMVPMSINWKYIFETADMLEEMGVRKLSFLRFVPQGRGKDHPEYLLTKREFRDLQYMLLSLVHDNKLGRRKLQFRLGHPIDFTALIDPSRPFKVCRGGFSAPLVEPQGRCVMCPAWKNLESYAAGNIREQSIVDIWFKSKYYQEFRNFIIKGWKEMMGACKDCPYLAVCKGKCTAQRIYAYGKGRTLEEAIRVGPDPLCFYDIV